MEIALRWSVVVAEYWWTLIQVWWDELLPQEEGFVHLLSWWYWFLLLHVLMKEYGKSWMTHFLHHQNLAASSAFLAVENEEMLQCGTAPHPESLHINWRKKCTTFTEVRFCNVQECWYWSQDDEHNCKAKCLSLLGHGNECMTIDSCPSELSAFLAMMEEEAFSL